MTPLELALVIISGVLAVALVVLLLLHGRQARELCRMRERYAHEASSHYRTWTLLGARERQIGRLGEQLRGLEEIAMASALGAQLYRALARDLRGEDLGQDPAFSASDAPSAPSAHL